MGCQVGASTPVKADLPISSLYGRVVEGKVSLLISPGDLVSICHGCLPPSCLPNTSPMPTDGFPCRVSLGMMGGVGSDATGAEIFPSFT